MEALAEAADVAKGTFFNYFESKETLLGALLFERTQSLLDDPPGANLPVQDRIRALLEAVRDELSPYAHLFPRMFAYAVSHPQTSRPTAEHPALWHAIAAMVREGQEDGTFRDDLDPNVAGALLASYFFRISILECEFNEDGQGFCWKDRVDSGLDILYRGLLSPDRAP